MAKPETHSDPHFKTWKDHKEPSQLSTDSTHELPLLHYTWTIYRSSCEGSDMRMIERQLQTAVQQHFKVVRHQRS
ncbi:hypothetical protein TNCV_3016351 [Trichonephila clavipes]|nr:hypothetical protein TNCV_3016351 [Trichonephila clavipes]